MTTEKCPRCGAAGEMNQAHSQVDYDCGSYQYVRSPVTDPDVDDEWTGKLFRLYACYERQLAQKDAEIERLLKLLKDIGDYAHDNSTAPAIEDGYWEIRRLAYAELQEVK